MTSTLAIVLPQAQHLHALDLTVVAFYLAGITVFGLRFRKRGKEQKNSTLQSYFLADNTVPWWAIALSIVSAETLTLTIISIPGIAFGGNFGFLQVVMGYMLGRVVVAALFLPRYFAGNMLTAYQLIQQRFGPTLHKTTAGLFLLTRAAAEGVRVFAVSIVVGIAIGTGDVLSIAIISALTLLYTFEGGMAAVIWTDVVQMAIYIAGTLVAVWSLGHHVAGGWHQILSSASAAGKLHTFDFNLNLASAAFWAKSYTFWAGLLGGGFLTMASHGTDQLMVQRMLAARNLRESRLALLSSGVVVFMQFTLFLLIGTGLWAFYSHANSPSGPWAQGPGPSSPDRIFPTFIVHELPTGIAGLLVAAILAAAMSNLSAALNSLSSSTVVDFYMTFRPAADARERNLVSRTSTVVWAFVLFALAVYSLSVGGKGHVVETGLSIASVAYGALLGVFLLGTLTRYATQAGTIIGMIGGFTTNMLLWLPTITPLRTIGDHPIPHIAFTWYVLIGAAVTFFIGSLASLIFRNKPPVKAIAAVLVTGVILSAAKDPRILSAQARALRANTAGTLRTDNRQPTTDNHPPSYDFSALDTQINNAIADHKLPGAVLVIGHGGQVVYQHAYGLRKLAGEPGLNGKPSPAEPMTEDTIFDMASLTKCLATATAVMQLYEAGKIGSFDDPIAKYLPEFLNAPSASTRPLGGASNGAQTDTSGKATSAEGATTYQPGVERPAGTAEPQVSAPDTPSPEGATYTSATNARAHVTIRMLLTHFSGEAPDVSLKDPWGLVTPDKAEGIHRALTTPLAGTPGTKFVYSDINFILLGALIEKLTGKPEDEYVQEHIFSLLEMTHTRYLPISKACGNSKHLGAAIVDDHPQPEPGPNGTTLSIIRDFSCPTSRWITDGVLPQTAPTAHDDESKANPAANPNFDHLLRGTVHDPTTRRMGGVAGHAGVFSTAHDMSLFAQALLDRLAGRPSNFPLMQSTLELMTTPEQPGHTTDQLAAANNANQAAISETAKSSGPSALGPGPSPRPDPLLAPNYPAIKGQDLRAFGWDIDTAYSKPRGRIFPIGSFGHTGFTGTSLWMDPGSDTYVILLANAIHPRGGAPISPLRGEVATLAAQSLHLYESTPPKSSATHHNPVVIPSGTKDPGVPQELTKMLVISTGAQSAEWRDLCISCSAAQASPETTHGPSADNPGPWALGPAPSLLTGIDVLEATHAAALQQLTNGKPLKLGLLTNQSGLDRDGHRTIDYLASLRTDNLQLTTLFSPEHGISGAHDAEKFAAETDPATGLHVTSLYGAHDADRRPTHVQLANLDAVVIDLQDAGVRTYTYPAAVGYFLEAAATEKSTYNHDLAIVLLDRPNLIDGSDVQGPVADPGHEGTYTDYTQVPIRHGLTLGEFAQYVNGEKHFHAHLVIVAMRGWQRTAYMDQTGWPVDGKWTNPSPNLRNQNAAILLPALTLLETTNVSVGRGTEAPFELFGAGSATTPAAPGPDSRTRLSVESVKPVTSSLPASSSQVGSSEARAVSWFHASEVATALTARHIPGVAFEPATATVDSDPIHPYHGQTMEAVRIRITDRNALDSPELNVEILSALHKLYPTDFKLARAGTFLASQSTLDAITRGDDPRSIAAAWQPGLDAYKHTRQKYLLY